MSELDELARRMMLYGLNIVHARTCAAIAIDYANDRLDEEAAKAKARQVALRLKAAAQGGREAYIKGARAAMMSRALIAKATDRYVGGAAQLADKWLNDMIAKEGEI